jgi:hypothetical protein
MAFNFGRYTINDGIVAGAGIRCLFKISTTKKTKMETAATNLNINLSVMFLIIDLLNQ